MQFVAEAFHVQHLLISFKEGALVEVFHHRENDAMPSPDQDHGRRNGEGTKREGGEVTDKL